MWKIWHVYSGRENQGTTYDLPLLKYGELDRDGKSSNVPTDFDIYIRGSLTCK